ncbi:MAG: SPOR domain-containing protein [Bacteroidetes bacterium]|nr:SPOR domain-containing protein [Bacteroidota bacterium]
MPNLNVKGESSGKASSGGGGSSKLLLYVLIAVVGLAVAAFLLNKTGVVKLWGKKKPQPVVVNIPVEDEYIPPTIDTMQQMSSDSMLQTEAVDTGQPKENTTIVEPKGTDRDKRTKSVDKKAPSNIVMGTGMYSVQISSFTSEEKANAQARAYSNAGYPAFVERMGGWYRVCIGRFESRSLAKAQGDKIVHMLENNYAIVKVNQ